MYITGAVCYAVLLYVVCKCNRYVGCDGNISALSVRLGLVDNHDDHIDRDVVTSNDSQQDDEDERKKNELVIVKCLEEFSLPVRSCVSYKSDELVLNVPSPGISNKYSSVEQLLGNEDNCIISSDIEAAHRLVVDECIICLNNFEIENGAETLTWSSNESCPHVFHHSCTLRWLTSEWKSSNDRKR